VPCFHPGTSPACNFYSFLPEKKFEMKPSLRTIGLDWSIWDEKAIDFALQHISWDWDIHKWEEFWTWKDFKICMSGAPNLKSWFKDQFEAIATSNLNVIPSEKLWKIPVCYDQAVGKDPEMCLRNQSPSVPIEIHLKSKLSDSILFFLGFLRFYVFDGRSGLTFPKKSVRIGNRAWAFP